MDTDAAAPGPGSTKNAILEAARQEFAQVGYGGATIRAIAATAGVDPALVIHYFKNKEALFVAALQMSDSLPARIMAAIDGPPEEFAHRFVTTFLGLWEDPVTAPLLASVVRSALTSPVAAEIGRRLFERNLAAAAGLPCTPERYNLAAAELLGIAIARYVVRLGPIASIPHDELVTVVTAQIQVLLPHRTHDG